MKTVLFVLLVAAFVVALVAIVGTQPAAPPLNR